MYHFSICIFLGLVISSRQQAENTPPSLSSFITLHSVKVSSRPSICSVKHLFLSGIASVFRPSTFGVRGLEVGDNTLQGEKERTNEADGSIYCCGGERGSSRSRAFCFCPHCLQRQRSASLGLLCVLAVVLLFRLMLLDGWLLKPTGADTRPPRRKSNPSDRRSRLQ